MDGDQPDVSLPQDFHDQTESEIVTFGIDFKSIKYARYMKSRIRFSVIIIAFRTKIYFLIKTRIERRLLQWRRESK